MTITEALSLVKKETVKKLNNKVLDDGDNYIFSYTESVTIPPIAVNKETKEVFYYQPFKHKEAFKNAKTITI